MPENSPYRCRAKSDSIGTLGQCSGGMINRGPSQSSELEGCACEWIAGSGAIPN